MSWRILSLNIEGDKHFDTVLPLLQAEKPDVICLQEVFAADVPRLVETTGYAAHYQPIVTYTMPNKYDISPRGDWGPLTLTKNPPLEATTFTYKGDQDRLPVFMDGQPNSANRAALMVQIGQPDRALRTINTHFTWSPNGQANDEQRRDLAVLLRQLETYDEFVLCGDFNAPRGGEIFAQFADRFTDNLPAHVTTTIDGQFHYAGDLQIVVDGLFTTPAYQSTQVEVLGGLSDHKAILATIDSSQAADQTASQPANQNPSQKG